LEFAHVFKQGRRTRARYFTLVSAPGTVDYPRLGLAIGRRASPRAVVRNRIKRIVRDAFRHAALPAQDIVVVARGGLDAVPRARLRADIEHAMTHLDS